MRAVDRLVPEVSTVTRYIRYHSLYAAIAAHAERNAWDITASTQEKKAKGPEKRGFRYARMAAFPGRPW
ncbi:hypothetical protein [Streptomyces sp. SLBN-134]|uniref:hypothetical protein n=1 Tax=Streptomyces sp. SLBN-134 TaxID=2768456 RepID=UPI00116BDC0E|nr:hypothetical protein [Streptomyces sp. SLBN-134]TQL18982.1 hypothetical protein FBY37_0889 [Streptomyces sp. SLBN-134]